MFSVKKVAIIGLMFAATPSFASGATWTLPPAYTEMPAEQQRALLWRWTQNSQYRELPAVGLTAGDIARAVWPPYLHRTFEHTSDTMPRDRRKIVHPYGATAIVRFEALDGHPFTGLLASGATGMVRLSLAAVSEKSYSPGMGLKLFVDGAPSVNFVATYSLDGQTTVDGGGNRVPDRNFFENPLNTHIPNPCALALQAGSLAFRLAIRTMRRGPVSELIMPTEEAAIVDRHGQAVTDPVAPHSLLFMPTNAVRGLISPDTTVDFRRELAKVPAGSVMYDVYAVGEEGMTPVQVGSIVLESGLTASRFGDEGLFFQHQRLVTPAAP